MNAHVRRMAALLHGAFEGARTSATQLGVLEQFAPPHTFAPSLTLRQACFASLAAVVRIVLGSLTFALWGVGMILTWNQVPYLWLRVPLVTVEGLLFLISMLLLQAGISALRRRL